MDSARPDAPRKTPTQLAAYQAELERRVQQVIEAAQKLSADERHIQVAKDIADLFGDEIGGDEQ